MNAADLHDLELIWPYLGATDVVVTGTFDQWSASIHLVKGDTGFSGIVKVPWGQKIAYKFIVDSRWRCRDDLPQEDDGHGNTNNILQIPEKPEPQFPVVHHQPRRLSIPLGGAESGGYGDVENMVTAVEYLPEPAVTKGSLPPPIPQITVEGLAQAPSAGTPVSESKLNTAAATEGHVSPHSETPVKPGPLEQALDVSAPPINGNGPGWFPSVNGNGEPHDSSPSVPEVSKDAVFAPLESAVLHSNHSPLEIAKDTPTPTDRIDVPSASTPVVVPQPTAKQVQVEPAAQSPQQATSPASVALAPTSSTPGSSTLTHKKRRSLLARIKHIFDRDNDKQERKKNKH